ncbi:hypothetical protein NQ315_005820 [Exocentrus adspersus]|uniref:Glyoxylate reductase/hydroxypyruvate reductase n=1 Tax=Exocentrus adspersus TaxID=1586481 RepID=A0AAV8VR74_9CUCU|nr:hypothetical protein NQ315_005820 [Exocentrus adspersus]
MLERRFFNIVITYTTVWVVRRAAVHTKMNRPKVLVSNPTVPQIGFDLLQKYCDIIRIENENETKEEIISKVKGVDAIYWASRLKLDKDIIEAAGPQMKVVGTMSAGYNHIDVDELKKRGIKLGNTPNVLNNAVADIAVLLALAASRRIHEGRLKIENNQWDLGSQWMLGQDISGATVGIIGLGGIGQAIVKRLIPFEVQQFLYTGHREKVEGKELGAKFVSLDTLVRESDFVIVSCPLNSETEEMCNEDFFAKMKKTAVFVNISRGKVVHQPSLVKALRDGQIFAAGLDVMTPEPLPPDDELLKLPNAVIVPHLGSATKKN